MRYLGGKHRIAPKFAHILEEALLERDRVLVEPFVGGFNVVPAIQSYALKRAVCSDTHPGLITMYKAMQDGWEPPRELCEFEWKMLKMQCDWSNPLTAFAAFGCSFGGKEWGGYAHDKKGERNFAAEQRRDMLRSNPKKFPVEFLCCDYRDLELDGCVVYCDPPYRGTTGYKTESFDSDQFYTRCEQMTENNIVFVSEFAAPSHWEVVWSAERKLSVRRRVSTTVTEKLFRVVPR